jgi:hypothetical protein
MFSNLSKDGKRARTPKWWLILGESFPKFSLPFIKPRVWTKELAEKWVKAIPDKCPFERQLWIGNTLVLYIPALCPLNPISKQLYSIKLEARTYLYDLEKKNVV